MKNFFIIHKDEEKIFLMGYVGTYVNKLKRSNLDPEQKGGVNI